MKLVANPVLAEEVTRRMPIILLTARTQDADVERLQLHLRDGTLKEVEVVTGQSDGRYTVVTSDELKTGMKVVTSLRAEGQ